MKICGRIQTKRNPDEKREEMLAWTHSTGNQNQYNQTGYNMETERAGGK